MTRSYSSVRKICAMQPTNSIWYSVTQESTSKPQASAFMRIDCNPAQTLAQFLYRNRKLNSPPRASWWGVANAVPKQKRQKLSNYAKEKSHSCRRRRCSSSLKEEGETTACDYATRAICTFSPQGCTVPTRVSRRVQSTPLSLFCILQQIADATNAYAFTKRIAASGGIATVEAGYSLRIAAAS